MTFAVLITGVVKVLVGEYGYALHKWKGPSKA